MPGDPARLLGAVAEALNQCERAGVTVDPDHGAVSTRYGYVIAVGDARLGGRWAVRQKIPAGNEKGDDDD